MPELSDFQRRLHEEIYRSWTVLRDDARAADRQAVELLDMVHKLVNAVDFQLGLLDDTATSEPQQDQLPWQ